MTDKVTYLTREGMTKLRAEHEHLIRIRRREIATRIQDAKELGDLSENAEYQEAKDEQAFNEGRIEELENTLRHAVIIEENQVGETETVHVGSSLTAITAGRPITLHVVGSNEADPLSGKISNESPLGQALLGKRLHDHVTIETPKGQASYEITKVW